MKKFIFISALLFLLPKVGECVQTKPYNYYVGPWVWVEYDEINEPLGDAWYPPEGTVGAVDLRPTAFQAQKTIPDGYGLFAVDGILPAPYYHIGYGFLDEVIVTNSMKSKIKQYIDYKPTSDTLLDVLWELKTTGADPTGTIRNKGMLPTIEGNLEFHFPGHSLVKKEKFVYGVHPHTENVRKRLRIIYRKIKQRSVLEGSNRHRRKLDWWAEKYKVSKPQDHFIPDDLPKETPLPHGTTLTDDFGRGSSDIFGQDISWTEVTDDWDTTSGNTGIKNTGNVNEAYVRTNTGVDGDDNYCQTRQWVGGSVWAGCGTRADTSVKTAYLVLIDVNNMYLQKIVNGTRTALGGGAVSYTYSAGNTIKVEANGSAQEAFHSGVSKRTDSDEEISTGSRGIYMCKRTSTSHSHLVDDFELGDLAAAAVALPVLITNIT